MCTTFPPFTLHVIVSYIITARTFYFFPHRYQRYSTTFTPHNSERQRERQRGLVKQTFELDEAAAAERQDDQVAGGGSQVTIILNAD